MEFEGMTFRQAVEIWLKDRLQMGGATIFGGLLVSPLRVSGSRSPFLRVSFKTVFLRYFNNYYYYYYYYLIINIELRLGAQALV